MLAIGITRVPSARNVVRASPMVFFHEASVWVSGKNGWERMFFGALAGLNVIRPNRVKRNMLQICN